MNWIELSVTTDAEGAEAVAAELNEIVSTGAVIEQTLLPEENQTFDPARAFTVRAFFAAHERDILERAENALWHLAQLRPMGTPQTRELAEEDWAEAWKKYYTILHLGKRLVIKPSWLAYESAPDEIIVELDPGMAFGTGLHPTTRLCMVALEEQTENLAKAQSAKPSQDFKMLDVGCGSGILSITAAKLGARDILALDLDPVAVETTTRNIAFNHVESLIRVEHRSVDAEKDCNQYDFLCINILAEIICDLAPAVAQAVRAGGIIIASGILDFKVDNVREAFDAVGIDVVEKKQEDDWVTLVCKKRLSDDWRLATGD
jgi:ribosomal protein L11 methyltransferase